MVRRAGLEPAMPKPRFYRPLRYQFRSPTRAFYRHAGKVLSMGFEPILERSLAVCLLPLDYESLCFRWDSNSHFSGFKPDVSSIGLRKLKNGQKKTRRGTVRNGSHLFANMILNRRKITSAAVFAIPFGFVPRKPSPYTQDTGLPLVPRINR